jgi:hypothetical protein
MGCYKIEDDKRLYGNVYSIDFNKLLDINDFSIVKTYTIDEEKDFKTSDAYMNKVKEIIGSHDKILIEADYPGAGKSTCAKEYDANAIFIAPYNVLCQDINEQDFEAITLHKLIGVDSMGHKTTPYDISGKKTVTFDEVYLKLRRSRGLENDD